MVVVMVVMAVMVVVYKLFKYNSLSSISHMMATDGAISLLETSVSAAINLLSRAIICFYCYVDTRSM